MNVVALVITGQTSCTPFVEDMFSTTLLGNDLAHCWLGRQADPLPDMTTTYVPTPFM